MNRQFQTIEIIAFFFLNLFIGYPSWYGFPLYSQVSTSQPPKHSKQELRTTLQDSSLKDSAAQDFQEPSSRINEREESEFKWDNLFSVVKNVWPVLVAIALVLAIVNRSLKIKEYFTSHKKVKNYSHYLNTLIKKYEQYESFIDIELKSIDKSYARISEDDDSSKPITFQQLLENKTRFQVFGKPGAGKTGALLKLLFSASKKALREKSSKIPVFIEFKGSDVFYQIRLFFHSNSLIQDFSLVNENWLREELSKGKFLILIDDFHKILSGGDQLENTRLQELLSYDKNNFILVSRDYRRSHLFALDTYEIAQLNPETAKKILAFYTGEYDANEIYRAIRWPHDLSNLFCTPQMLRFLTEVYINNDVYNFRRLPANKSSMFSQFLKMRDKHESQKDHKNSNFTTLRNELLRSLAINNIANSKEYWIEENKCLELFQETFKKLKRQDLNPDIFLEEILKEGFLIRFDGMLRFEHDQWQEFFAASAIFKKKLSLRDFEEHDSFHEIVYFVAGMHDYEKNDESRDFCDHFLKELVEIDFLLFARCLRNFDKHRFLSEKYEAFKDKTFSQEQIEKAYSDFLSCYSHIIDIHFPASISRFSPYTSDRAVGVIVEIDEGSMGHWEGFRRLESANEKNVIITHKKEVMKSNQIEQDHGRSLYYIKQYNALDLHKHAINPVLYELPVIAAFNTIAEKLEEIIKDLNLADPPELEQEKLYFEALAFKDHLYISREQKEIFVKDIAEGLVKAKIEKEIYRKFLSGTTLNLSALRAEVERLFEENHSPRETYNSTTYVGLHSRKVNDKEFEMRFNNCVKINNWNERDEVKPPMAPKPKKIRWARQINLSETERNDLIEWSKVYHEKFYNNYKLTIERNFPSCKNSFETYQEFPLLIILACDEDLPKTKLQFGERYIFRRMKLQKKPVVVEVLNKAKLPNIEKKLYANRWLHYPYWGIGSSISNDEPLCTAVYELVKREYEELINQAG